jgi:aspartate carbamoyltransferase catalytic subunit
MARYVGIPVVNAGDGMHEHPSQALLDALTILRHRRNLRGLRVVIVGDIYHSRVARSNVHLLTKMGAHVTLCGPPEFAPEVAATLARGLRVTRHFDEALRGADVVMMLRVQKERLAGRQIRLSDYVAGYQLTSERLRLARRDALVMHPGPMIRGMELTNEVADGMQSVIREQVANGVAVRMAILARLLGAAR